MENSLERIYPKQLNIDLPAENNSLGIHLARYEFAEKHLNGKYILDIACGCGYGTALLAEKNPDKEFIGVDIDRSVISYAQKNYKAKNLRYICADAMNFCFQTKLGDRHFDTIISIETIEHVPYPQKMVSHLLTQLNEHGIMIASVPTTPTVDGNPFHLHDFTVSSFYKLFSASNYLPVNNFEQIQAWEFKGIFSKKTSDINRSQGIGRRVIRHYFKNPSALFFRLYAMLSKGLNNRYLTTVFMKSDNKN